jgi:hypothetical protein
MVDSSKTGGLTLLGMLAGVLMVLAFNVLMALALAFTPLELPNWIATGVASGIAVAMWMILLQKRARRDAGQKDGVQNGAE